MLVHLISTEELTERIVPEVLLLADIAQKDISRKISAELFKEILKTDRCPPSVVSKAKSLSQDIAFPVRQAITEFWVLRLQRSCKLDDIAFLELVKLVNDDNVKVKRNAMKLYIEVFPCLPKTQSILKVVLDSVIPEFYEWHKGISQLILNCFASFPTEIIALVDSLLTTSVHSREVLAYNFPCIVSVMGLNQGTRELLSTLSKSEPEVQLIIAKGLHEVIKLSPQSKAVKLLAVEWLGTDLQEHILKNTSVWASYLSTNDILFKLIKNINRNSSWRVQYAMLTQCVDSLSAFNLQVVLEHLVPLVLHKMLCGNIAIKQYSAYILAKIVYSTFYIVRKNEICSIVTTKLGKSAASPDRVTFILFFREILPLQSSKFVKSHFWSTALALAEDPISSVRIALAQTLTLISENLYFECSTDLEALLLTLSNDPVREVLEIASVANKIFHSSEFVAKIHSKPKQAELAERLDFEKQQEMQEIKETEDAKNQIVNNLTAKVYADMKQKGNRKLGKARGSFMPPRDSKSSASLKIAKRK